MHGVNSRAELVRRGYTRQAIDQLVSRGELVRLSKDVYVEAGSEESQEARHRDLVIARAAKLEIPAVVSHVSAAVMHGLPVWPRNLNLVEISRPAVGGGRASSGLRIHPTRLLPVESTIIDGVRVTSLARTVADLCRSRMRWTAVSAGDVALNRGLTRAELSHMIRRMAGWPGIVQARHLIPLLDGASESPGESVSRLQMSESGIEPPRLQYPITYAGEVVARVDFYWPDHHLVGEFDGRVKYRPDSPFRGDPTTRVYAEKRREDRIRAAGNRVVRWGTDELRTPDMLPSMLKAAMNATRRTA